MANDWDTKAEFMRRHGATAAEWSWDGLELVSLVLGPVPHGPRVASQVPAKTTTPSHRIGSSAGLTRPERADGDK